MTYEEWEATVPALAKEDRVWRVQAYRLALYLADAATLDARGLATDPRFTVNVTQLCKAAGSVSANIAEGYPRRSSKDRIKFYEYALTSLAEAKSWYLQIRGMLAGATMNDRLATMRSIARLLITMMRSARANGAIDFERLQSPSSSEPSGRVERRKSQ